MRSLLYDDRSRDLVTRMARRKGFRLFRVATRRFADGESYVRIEKPGQIRGSEAWICLRVYPDIDMSLVSLALILESVSALAPKEVNLILPYFPYARQDKRFIEGEAISYRAVLRLCRAFGVGRIITVNAHFCRGTGQVTEEGIRIVNLNAVKLLIASLKRGLKRYTVLGIDEGAKGFLGCLNESVAYMSKRKTCTQCGETMGKCRCRSKDVTYTTSFFYPRLEEKNILVVDDIIGSGRTLLQALKPLKGNSLRIGCVHGLFLGDGEERLSRITPILISTDTVISPFSKVSVAELIAQEIE